MFEARIAAARASVDWTVPGFAALSGIGCLSSPPISEKLFRGGSTTSVPKRYAFEFCPFANVSQREDGPLAWKPSPKTQLKKAKAGMSATCLLA